MHTARVMTVWCFGVLWGLAATCAADGPASFALRPVDLSAPKPEDKDLAQLGDHGAGVIACPLSESPSPQVRKYPKAVSKQARYGHLPVDDATGGPSQAGPAPTKIHFLLDVTQPPAAKTAPKKTTLDVLGGLIGGMASRDEAPQFDRLYFDANGDGDLTNDPPISPAAKIPQTMSGMVDSQARGFEITLPERTTKTGKTAKTKLWLLCAAGMGDSMVFCWAPEARCGEIRVGQRKLLVVLTLGSEEAMAGSYQSGATRVFVKSLSDESKTPARPARSYSMMNMPGGWEPASLGSLRHEGGQWFRLSCSPQGDRLTVAPFDKLGLLELSLGARKADLPRSIEGTLLGPNGVTISLDGDTSALPPPPAGEEPKPAHRHRLPEGDYRLANLDVQLGRVHFSIDSNPEAVDSLCQRNAEAGKPPAGGAAGYQEAAPRPQTFPVAIRKEKAYVLNFSERPTVAFTNRPQAPLRPGDTAGVSALLVDAKQGWIYGRMEDASSSAAAPPPPVQPGAPPLLPLPGAPPTFTIPSSAVPVTMHPEVTVRDSKGTIVATGAMKYG